MKTVKPSRPAFVLLACLAIAAPAVAQGGGGEDSGGSTVHGDQFGDLVHVLRDGATGRPILLKKMIEYPQDVVDWGYCPIPVDATGAPLPLLELSCEVDPAFAHLLVEVDYFGRLSGGRVKERNQRMHLDEMIVRIKEAQVIDRDQAGRIRFGFECEPGGTICATWKTIDSPMENMGLYVRLMKFGHIQTDPMEEDTFPSGGDPAAGPQYHPALDGTDWAKFTPALSGLLPRRAVSECFGDGGSFTSACAAQEELTAEDFMHAASFMGGAADKHGKTTVDLVQYFNRIVKIPVSTPESPATLRTLPALYCTEIGGPTYDANDTYPAPANERFVDYSVARYLRTERFHLSVPALVRSGVGTWTENPSVPLLPYLEYSNGPASPLEGLAAFVANGADAQRAIEFLHEYAIPVDLMPPLPPAPVYVQVPNVVGLMRVGAEAAIAAAALVVGSVTTTPNPAAVGTVLAQDPAAAASVLEGTAVNLTVSAGPPLPEVCTAPPNAPTSLSASAIGAFWTLNWLSGGPVGANAPTSYSVEADVTNPFSGPLAAPPVNTGSAATTYSFTVPAGTSGTFYLRLRAVNACGVSAATSNVITVIIP